MGRDGSRALLLTHVDSSTGVLVDVAQLASVGRRRGGLVLVDGIAGAGAEAVAVDGWGVDLYVTSTPKGLGVPAGLILIATSERVTAALRDRAFAPASVALDLARWLDAMDAAEHARYAYWQSPAGNLVAALELGLALMLDEGPARLRRHAGCRDALHRGLAALGLEILAGPRVRSHGITVCRYPAGRGPELLASVREHDVSLPAGSHPELAAETFRIGHLGNVTAADVRAALAALEAALASPPLSIPTLDRSVR
jgi:alanine-glyoxylate transaminase/serine-glyoxylate transaminase/serine-pyruvate transaminase